jgi:ATP-binding cassette subfamily G (WHITE) protein 2
LNDAYKQSAMYTDMQEFAQQENSLNNTQSTDRSQGSVEVEAAQSFQAEIFYVSQRTLRIALRNPAMALAQIVVSIMIALFIGLVFYDLKKTTDPGVQNRLGAIFFIVVNQIFNTMTAIEPLIQERVLFLHVSSSCSTNTKCIHRLSGIWKWLLQNSHLFYCQIDV